MFPVLSSYTGRAKRMSYLYHPCAASALCLAFRFSSCVGSVAIPISSGTACAAFALAFATAPFKAIRLSERAYSSGKSDEIYILSEKLTVDKKYRNLVLPLSEIEEIIWKWIVFSVATFYLKSGETFSFIIFNKPRFNKYYHEYCGNRGDRNSKLGFH